jgi:hypothetical protein
MNLAFFLFFFSIQPPIFFLSPFILSQFIIFFSISFSIFFLIIIELSLDRPDQLDHVKITFTRFNFKHGLDKESGQDFFSFQFHSCFPNFILILCKMLSGLSLE